MGTDFVGTGDRSADGWSRTIRPSSKYVPLAQLRKLRECEQVAAVCYRVRGGDIEFLLVRTRGGRWIFPKGNSELGLTHAQAAALEAFEEAGVHGRMQEACLVRYTRNKRDPQNSSVRSNGSEVSVNVHLCEVLRTEPPPERDRNPTWFSGEKAKRRLREGRPADYGDNLTDVIDRAVKRIRRSMGGTQVAVDALQKVRFIDAGRRTGGSGKGPSRLRLTSP